MRICVVSMLSSRRKIQFEPDSQCTFSLRWVCMCRCAMVFAAEIPTLPPMLTELPPPVLVVLCVTETGPVCAALPDKESCTTLDGCGFIRDGLCAGRAGAKIIALVAQTETQIP